MSFGRLMIPVLLGIALVAGILLATTSGKGDALTATAAVLEYRHGELLYTFHIPTGTEALFNLKQDPACLDNILPENRKTGAMVRKRLELQLRVDSLEELRDENNPVLKSLRGLGYI